jgi:hypothetical protein
MSFHSDEIPRIDKSTWMLVTAVLGHDIWSHGLDGLAGWPRLQKILRSEVGLPLPNSNPEFLAALSSVRWALEIQKKVDYFPNQFIYGN